MNTKRRFIVGEEWLYLKIYTGPKNLERVLLDEIYPLASQEYQAKRISKFFFVRYSAGGEHIRVRFELQNPDFGLAIIKAVSKRLSPYIDKRIISHLSIDTYNRELERYGQLTIIDFETIFCSSSFDILKILKQTDDYQTRWLFGVKWLDELFKKFDLATPDRYNLYESYYLGFLREFGESNVNKDTLKKRYREVSDAINSVMIQGYPLFDGPKLNAAIGHILELNSANQLERSLPHLLADIIHMHFNRMFPVNARAYELVLSYMLSNYYKSEMMRTRNHATKTAL